MLDEGCFEIQNWKLVEEYYETLLAMGSKISPSYNDFENYNEMILKAWCNLNKLDKAVEYVQNLPTQQQGLTTDQIVFLVNLLSKELLEKGETEKAVKLCEHFKSNAEFKPHPETVLVMIKSYCESDNITTALATIVDFSLRYSTGKKSMEILKMESEMYKFLFMSACKKLDGAFIDEILISMKRDDILVTSEILNILIEYYIKQDLIDDALKVYLSFKFESQERLREATADLDNAHNIQSLKQELKIPVSVYNYILAGLASHFRMLEFRELWNELKDLNLATSGTYLLVLESYLHVADVSSAFEVCQHLMDDITLEKPNVKLILKLLDATITSGKHKETAQVIRWIRLVSKKSEEEQINLEAVKNLKTKVLPITQLMEKFILEGLPEKFTNTKPLVETNDKLRTALDIYEELLKLDVSLPYSLYTAFIKHYHLRVKDMVGVARTWTSAVKQSKLQGQHALPAELVASFLHASKDLCLKQTASHVLKFVYTENIVLNKISYEHILFIASKFGWLDIVTDFLEKMENDGIKVDSNIFDFCFKNLKNFHSDANSTGKKKAIINQSKLFEKYMEKNFPEAIGSWYDISDNQLINEMKRLAE
ncbi:hypothetical protein HK099_005306 [Clydaea vesicula]|uniref:Pentatricopeptide repeat-containing protein n=1 Tax=Clydaea vesicula TaxID=447962 RepID=A0AAD5XXP2_9FUNG|nr:hypothetical protein HK099_005306 [Clydaea vesicula]